MYPEFEEDQCVAARSARTTLSLVRQRLDHPCYRVLECPRGCTHPTRQTRMRPHSVRLGDRAGGRGTTGGMATQLGGDRLRRPEAGSVVGGCARVVVEVDEDGDGRPSRPIPTCRNSCSSGWSTPRGEEPHPLDPPRPRTLSATVARLPPVPPTPTSARCPRGWCSLTPGQRVLRPRPARSATPMRPGSPRSARCERPGPARRLLDCGERVADRQPRTTACRSTARTTVHRPRHHPGPEPKTVKAAHLDVHPPVDGDQAAEWRRRPLKATRPTSARDRTTWIVLADPKARVLRARPQ
jgi:hypothetical protein